MNQIIKITLDFLDKNNINYRLQEHGPVFTVEDIEKIGLKVEGLGVKTLFLRNRKGKNFYLIAINDSKRLDLKKMAEILNEKRLNFATENNLEEYLKVKPGSITPLALMFNEQKNVKLIIDQDLWEADLVSMHPNKNTATITLDNTNFQRIINTLGSYKIFPL